MADPLTPADKTSDKATDRPFDKAPTRRSSATHTSGNRRSSTRSSATHRSSNRSWALRSPRFSYHLEQIFQDEPSPLFGSPESAVFGSNKSAEPFGPSESAGPFGPSESAEPFVSSVPLEPHYRLILEMEVLLALDRRTQAPGGTFAPRVTKADVICRGIERIWSGHFPLSPSLAEALDLLLHEDPAGQAFLPLWEGHREKIQELQLVTTASRAGFWPAHQLPVQRMQCLMRGDRAPISVYFKPMRLMPSHVRSSPFFSLWGIFRYGHPETLGFNWFPQHPGSIFLDSTRNQSILENIAAHELGHTLGLADAYGAWYRAFYEAPNTRNYLMNSNLRLHEEELVMMLRAQATGRMQFFPVEFSLKHISKGFSEEVEYYRSRLEALHNKDKDKYDADS